MAPPTMAGGVQLPGFGIALPGATISEAVGRGLTTPHKLQGCGAISKPGLYAGRMSQPLSKPTAAPCQLHAVVRLRGHGRRRAVVCSAAELLPETLLRESGRG